MRASDFNGIGINILVKNNAIDKKSKPGGCLGTFKLLRSANLVLIE